MEFENGKIDVIEDDEKISYEIESMTVLLEEDRDDMPGILRCTDIFIESNAPGKINSEAQINLYNKFAAEEYNDADGSGSYRKEAQRDIHNATGIEMSRIEIR